MTRKVHTVHTQPNSSNASSIDTQKRLRCASSTPKFACLLLSVLCVSIISSCIPGQQFGIVALASEANLENHNDEKYSQDESKDDRTCDADGTCSNDDTSISNHQHNIDSTNSKISSMVQSLPDGSLKIHNQIYKTDKKANLGHEISRHVRRIRSNASLLKTLHEKMHSENQSKMQGRNDAHDEMLYQKYETTILLIEDFLSLALIHKEKWMQSMLQAHDDAGTGNNFQLAANAYEASLELYQNLWDEGIGKDSAADEEGGSPSLFTIYDREALSAGMSGVNLQLSDIFHQRYNESFLGGQGGTPAGPGTLINIDYSMAYRYLISSERWCKESLKLLQTNVREGDGTETEPHNKYYSSYDNLQEQEAHDLVIRTAKQTCSYAQLRMGTLLLDMFVVGYTWDPEGNLRLDSSSISPPFDAFVSGEGSRGGKLVITEDQRRIVLRALEKLHDGVQTGEDPRNEANRNPHSHFYDEATLYDNRLNIADAHNHMGVAHSYLSEWDKAAKEWETSLESYEQLFEKGQSDYSHNMEMGYMDLAIGMMTTTQSLWESQLHLGRMEEAKHVFRRHLLLHRFAELGIGLDEPLEHKYQDDGEDEAYFASSDEQDADHAKDFQNMNEVPGQDLTESLQTHQNMLEEYLRVMQSHPDGSYYEIGFDGDATYAAHDMVYEGSLRAVIGSLYLAQNQVSEARNELVLAVNLLREAASSEGGGYEFVGEDGRIIAYPIKLDLADALLNLAYSQLALKQFYNSFASFEESMDLYIATLPEGESPFHYLKDDGHVSNDKAENGARGFGFAERISRFFGKSDRNAEKESVSQLKQIPQNQHVNIEEYHVVNSTDTS